MGDSLEDLLAQLKAQYEGDAQSGGNQPDADKPPGSTSLPAKPQASCPPKTRSESLTQPDSIDDLLSQIEGKSTGQGTPPLPPPSVTASGSFPSASSAHQTNWQQIEAVAHEALDPKLPTFQSEAQSPASDALLNDLKIQYQEQDRVEALKRQEQQQAEQIRHEQRQRKKRTQAIQHAEAWLKALDPRSGEAAWFEEFASKYESRVDAAIDYLGLLAEP